MMDGAHDIGGVPGFGPVMPEADEPVFHAKWEGRIFAMTLAMGKPGGWNIDMSRSAREDLPREVYLTRTYFQIWLLGLERLLMDRDLVAPDEIETGQIKLPHKNVPALKADEVAGVLRRGGPSKREATQPARFAIGDRVRMKMINPPTHTRLPRYVRGHVGVIELLHGAHVFPDSNAAGKGEDPQWLYTVAFEGRELWGEESDSSVRVSVDAWDSYLERV
jgi:nitrile hydratase beta subunit